MSIRVAIGWLRRSVPVHLVNLAKAASKRASKLVEVEVVSNIECMVFREALHIVSGGERCQCHIQHIIVGKRSSTKHISAIRPDHFLVFMHPTPFPQIQYVRQRELIKRLVRTE